MNDVASTLWPQDGQPAAPANVSGASAASSAAPRQPAEPLTSIVIKTPRGEAEPVRLKLLEHPLTHSAEVIDDDEVRAAVRGGDADVSRVVGTVFAAGLTVLSFNRNQMGLEELFMKITQGKVS